MNNFEMMKHRLLHQGGLKQEARMIADKYKTFQRALEYSYQAADVEKIQDFNKCLQVPPYKVTSSDKAILEPTRALINPNKLKQDYDDKILSIDASYGLQCGDVFRWRGTNSYWLIYLEELTEDAYFRGDIRRCKYKIKFKNEEGSWIATWAAIRGPVETQIESIQKNQVRVDRANLSLNILLPKNKDTLYAFNRYKEFLFDGKCWRVEAPDSISMTNIIEVAAEEYYKNKDTDDLENEVVDGLILEPYDPTPGLISHIQGEGFIKPLAEWVYTLDGSYQGGTWSVTEGVPVEVQVNDEKSITLRWYKTSHGQFELSWTDGTDTLNKVIVVESLW